MRVGLIFGGRSVEHQVSINSARTVEKGLRQAGHTVVPLAVAQDGCWLDPEAGASVLAGGAETLSATGLPVAPSLRHLLESEAEVLFPVIHGTWGEDGTLQGLCEMVDLPYVGAGVTASAVGMDKRLTKRILRQQEIPVVDDESVEATDLSGPTDELLARISRLGTPVFVKPCVGGSSVGVKRVDSAERLIPDLEWALQFDERVLVERAVVGREIECAVLGYRKPSPSALGEIVPSKEFYDYEDKYLLDSAGLHAPADLPEDLTRRLRQLAVRSFVALGCWGMARVDFLLSESGEIFVNEVNTLPGFTSISMYPRLWEITGLPLPSLVDRLVRIAVRRHHDRAALDRGIKEWLSALG